MKNYIIWLSIALSFLCSKSTAQLDPSMILLSNRGQVQQTQQPQSVQQPQASTAKKQAVKVTAPTQTQHMVSSSVTVDTNGKSTNKSDWQAVFVKDRKEREMILKDGFHIEATMTKKQPNNNGLTSPLLTINEDYHNEGFTVSPAPVFDETKPITVQFSQDGKLIPINQIPQQIKAAIIDTMKHESPLTIQQIMKNVDPDDEIDSLFNTFKFFTYKKQVFEKYIEPKQGDYTKKRQIKAPKPKPLATRFAYSSKGTESAKAFIEEYSDEAQNLEQFGIPYAISMAMAIIESRHGSSELSKISNNIFSIKDKGGDCNDNSHRHVKITDDEENETFQVYNSFQDAFIGFKDFLFRNDRYDKCFACGMNEECWARNLVRAGYATTPNYGRMVISIINRYELSEKKLNYKK